MHKRKIRTAFDGIGFWLNDSSSFALDNTRLWRGDRQGATEAAVGDVASSPAVENGRLAGLNRAVIGAAAPSTIRLRREGPRGLEVAELSRQVLAKVGHDLGRGAMVTVTEGTIRVRHLPLQHVKSDL